MNLTDPIWNLVFLAAFVVYVGIRHVFQARVKGQQKLVQRADGSEKALLLLVFLGSLVAPALYLFTPLLDFANYELPSWLPPAGTFFLINGLMLFYRSHADLGVNWSVTLEIRDGHELVQSGVYERVRHPMYAAIFLFCIGQGLTLSNWLAGWAALPAFWFLYVVRTPREEALMLEHFGESYRAYMQRAGRLLPHLRSIDD